MKLQKWIVFLILSLHLCSITLAQVNVDYEYHACGDTGNYTQDSTYQNNLNTLLQSLSGKVNEDGFYNGSVGQGSDRASAIVLCRGDIGQDLCRRCVADDAELITEQQYCPSQKEAFRWYNICSIYYSDKSIIGSLQTAFIEVQNSNKTHADPAQLSQDLTKLVDRLKAKAINGGPQSKYAANNTLGGDSNRIYAYVQCTPDLSVQNCNDCLSSAFSLWNKSDGKDKIGARVLCPSCFFRYENYRFYENTQRITTSSTQPPSPSPPPPPPGKIKTWIIIVVAIVAGLIVLAICIFVISRRRQKRKANKYGQMEASSSIDEISVVESLQYDFSTIKNATGNFSEENKIGEGGFGAVYKGKLENGLEVAVKRLSGESTGANLDFINEVALVARLQHRNLVRLLGFSQEGREMLLLYEFVPNGSLDNILFDPTKRGCLNWGRRFKIIENIARGLVYLHEDSSFRIIHRDLKASNVLLDADLNAKISDFGTARLFATDETHVSTSKVVGTYGYMAPEYLYLGQFSVKSDVYSYGVLVLEIISGQKNSRFQVGESVKDLLGYAWMHWRDGTASSVMDTMLRDTSSPVHEITKCIHIALLCVQENVADRPTMTEVLQMLSNLTMSLPVPSVPRFFIYSSTVPEPVSRNEMSMSEQNAR